MRGLNLTIGTLRDQRGIALPMSLLALLILSTLVISFALLATSEPLIATNQKMVAQARGVAESGLEQAIWALNVGTTNPLDPNALTTMPAPSPYDGNTAIPISNSSGTQIGVAFVTVTQGSATNERNVVSVGWVPTDTGSGSKAHQRIKATVSQFLFSGSPPPASLTVRGEIDVNGNTNIDSRSPGPDTSCGPRDGTWSAGATTHGGSSAIYGADGGANAAIAFQSAASGPTDMKQSMPGSAFAPFTLSSKANGDLDTLKAIAKANGTYFSGADAQGLLFNSGRKIPKDHSIVFIDTVSGQNIDANGATTSTSDFASVAIHGGAEPADADPSGIFSGMIIVAGSLAISGDFKMHGIVYVVNDLTYTGTGSGQIDGAVISQNIRDISSTTIDTNTGGNASINYNCGYARNPGGMVPPGFNVQPGTYKEVSGSTGS
jgi:Tfp pilus assembly protein PilX